MSPELQVGVCKNLLADKLVSSLRSTLSASFSPSSVFWTSQLRPGQCGIVLQPLLQSCQSPVGSGCVHSGSWRSRGDALPRRSSSTVCSRADRSSSKVSMACFSLLSLLRSFSMVASRLWILPFATWRIKEMRIQLPVITQGGIQHALAVQPWEHSGTVFRQGWVYGLSSVLATQEGNSHSLRVGGPGP